MVWVAGILGFEAWEKVVAFYPPCNPNHHIFAPENGFVGKFIASFWAHNGPIFQVVSGRVNFKWPWNCEVKIWMIKSHKLEHN